MKVSYDWLKDFVDLKISPKELADKLTMAGLEVVSLEERSGDSVLEIEITSNRPDWLSILGVAREIGAITGARFKTKNVPSPKLKNLKTCSVSIEDKSDCFFYSALVIRGVRVGPSPEWLKKRLEALGCRSVNNIVDVTNYILFESGQPMHAFDLDRLGRQTINVRRARQGEMITTIDGQQKFLDGDMLVIADNKKAVAIAGVMGGKDTEVTDRTTNILLESAVFNPILVRKTRQKLGLPTESAYRFERGVDEQNARTAVFSAAKLITSLASGECFAYKCLGKIRKESPEIKLEADYISRILGAAIPMVRARQILTRLGFCVRARGKGALMVKAPSFRQDIKAQIDLVEEVARIYGYDKIPISLPAVKPQKNISGRRDMVCGIKNTLYSLGLQEGLTYSLVEREMLEKSGVKKDAQTVEIMNPLSKEQEVLRYSILPSLMRVLAYNLDQQQEYVNIFEIADIFSDKNNGVDEILSLGIALCGTRPFFLKQGLVKDELGILHLKGILEKLFISLGVSNYDFVKQQGSRVSVTVSGEEIGFMFVPQERILGSFDIKNKKAFLAELDLVKLLDRARAERKFSGIPKYPAVTRDLSFIVKEGVSIKEIIGVVKEKGAPLLSEAGVADYYQGKQIPAGFRGLTISCVYRSDDRTLTEEEVSPLHKTICGCLETRFGIKFR